jgi:integrase
LKIKNFDLVNGFIHLPGTLTKNKQNSIVTIPKSILHTIDEVWPHKLQANDYLFGGNKMIGANRLNNLHTTIVNQLHKKGIIEDTTGISIYSWKDTGAMSLIKAGINPYDIMSQMRHSELSTTMKYLKSLSTVNKDVQNLIATLLPTIS